MDEIYKYIDCIFKNIIHSKETKKLKEQMKTDAKEKYENLISEGIHKPDAVKKVIAEIGTKEDLNAKYFVTSRVLNIVAYIFIFLTVISIGYSIYVLINEKYFRLHFIMVPLYFSRYITTPFNFLGVAFLVLWFINRTSFHINKWVIQKKSIRISVLIFCICIIVFYFFNISWLYNWFHIGSMPTPFLFSTLFLTKNSFIFSPIGILLFMGIKK